jgi:hypothetical protein
VQACAGDVTCQDDCAAEASPNAIAESGALVQCIVDNNCMNEVCIQNNCGAELYSCYTGSASCGDMVGCAEGCAGDMACEADCFYESSGLAQAQVDALQTCITTNACEGDDACILENCNNELQSCVGGMSDTLPCPLVAECLIDCDGDEACALACGRSTPEVAAEADALAVCADAENCNNLNCVENNCPDEWGVCYSGDVACPDLWACVASCNGAGLCGYNCITEGTFMDQVLFGALAECANDNACQDQACIDANCSVEAMACGI